MQAGTQQTQGAQDQHTGFGTLSRPTACTIKCTVLWAHGHCSRRQQRKAQQALVCACVQPGVTWLHAHNPGLQAAAIQAS